MFRRAITISVAVACLGAAGGAQVNVLTANYGNERSNANIQEKLLTTGNVGPATFGRIGALPVDGQVYAQPLYVSGIVFPGQGTHNVVFIATQHNSLYAYDADQFSPPQLLWKANFGAPVLSSLFGNYTDIAPEIGILSTPVIDPVRGVIYAVSSTPSQNTIAYQVHALSLTTGNEMLNGPATVSASVNGNGTGNVNGTVSFDPLWHIQRPALLLANDTVWVAFGSHADQEPWHGWMLSYNADDLSKAPAAFSATPNGWGGSFWQSGFGIAADSTGNLYAISGNGSYDGVTNFGESFLKFSGATPMVTDSYTPPNYQLMEDQDYDLSAGPALIPGTHTLIGGDKYGLRYVVNGNAMGGLDEGNSGAQVVQASTNGVFNFAIRSVGANSWIYLQEKGGNLKAFSLGASGLSAAPVAASSTTSDSAYVGLTVSSDGAAAGTGIVWETTNNRSLPGVPGTLRAFDADNIATELWDSDMSRADALGRFAKFANPTVANGRVYVPTWSNAVVVYGAKSQASTLPRPVVQAVVNASKLCGGRDEAGRTGDDLRAESGAADPRGHDSGCKRARARHREQCGGALRRHRGADGVCVAGAGERDHALQPDIGHDQCTSGLSGDGFGSAERRGNGLRPRYIHPGRERQRRGDCGQPERHDQFGGESSAGRVGGVLLCNGHGRDESAADRWDRGGG